MPAMLTVVTVFAFVAIAIHVYIWILESFLWTKPKGREVFNMSKEFAESTKDMAANQGLYNLMLAWVAATGLLAFWFGGLPQVGIALMFAGLGSMAVAGIYLFLTSKDKRKPALIQFTPPLLALIFLLVVIYPQRFLIGCTRTPRMVIRRCGCILLFASFYCAVFSEESVRRPVGRGNITPNMRGGLKCFGGGQEPAVFVEKPHDAPAMRIQQMRIHHTDSAHERVTAGGP